MKHIDISRERTKRRIPRRFMGILLAAAVAVSVMPVGGFAVSSSEERTTELCAHHPEHTADCGYSVEDNTPCGYECRVCPVEVGEPLAQSSLLKDGVHELKVAGVGGGIFQC